MSFRILNTTPSAKTIADLGIQLNAHATANLSEEASKDVAISKDLVNAILASTVVVLDPLDNATPLSMQQSLDAVSVANDPNFRIHGGELDQLDDVAAESPVDGDILVYDGITQQWVAGPSNVNIITQNDHAFVDGIPIYFDGTLWKKARADNVDTLATAVTSKTTQHTFIAVTDGKAERIDATLIPGEWYYTSTTIAGQLTNVEPTSGFSNPLGFAESINVLVVHSIRASDLSAAPPGFAPQIIHQPSHGFDNGTPIYFREADHTWYKARANSSLTLAIGVARVIDTDNFEYVTVGLVENTTPLVTGVWYYVSDLFTGAITPTQPYTFSNPIGVAASTTSMFVIPMRAVDYTGT